MSRRSRRSKTSDKVYGVVFGVIGLALLILLGGGGFWLRQQSVALNAQTNCPETGPTAVHMVLIDRSDPISPQQALRIQQWVEAQKASSPAGTRFDIYAFEGDTQSVMRPLLSICVPQPPSTANPLIQNVNFVKKTFDEKFVRVLDETIASLLQATTRPTSPIIESLRAAALTSFGDVKSNGVPLQVTLISDLIQHSPETSHYTKPADFDQLSHNLSWSTLRPDLRGASVDILYVLRPKALTRSAPIQNRGHQDFWVRLIAGSGGRVTEITPF